MMIKVGNEFLEFSDLVETEKQVKLLEDLSTSDGDFSYSFNIYKTITNSRILQNPQPDNINKPVYQKIEASLLTDSGEETFKGFLRIERITKFYECSFFAGNNNWFGLLSGNLRELDWSEFDIEQTEANIIISVSNTSGLVFPLVDNGVLAYRGAAVLKVEDFIGSIYLKDIVSRIFSTHGIKLKGDLINNDDYNSAVVLSGGKSETAIDDRSTFAFTNNSPIPNDGTFYLMEWTDDSNEPYFDGSQNNFSLLTHRYMADVRMRIKIESIINTPVAPLFFYMRIYKNGVAIPGVLSTSDTFGMSIHEEVELAAGDYIDIRISADPGHGSPTTITDATVQITPTFVYKAFGSAIVPNWTQGKFIQEVFKEFNVLASYDAGNKILTADLFEKLKSKTPVDLSPYISEVETDYSEFISEYGKKSLLSHVETEPEEEFTKLRLNSRSYETGELLIDNDFLDDSVTIIESDFSSPITYVNPVFAMSQEKTNMINLDEDGKLDFSGVTDSSDIVRIAVPEDIFIVGDLVRIANSTNKSYNGDWVVSAVGAGYVEIDLLAYDTDATGEITKMKFVNTDSDRVYLLHHVPSYDVNKFSGLSEIQIETTGHNTLAIAFYNLIRTNRPVDFDFPFSMAFATGDQKSLTDKYFRLTERVLNDPVKLICKAHLPMSVYKELDFLSPVTIKTMETQNQYYLNRISGYKESFLPCKLELIKI